MALAVTARHSGNGGQTAAITLTTSSATESADSFLLVGSAAQNDTHTAAQDGQSLSGGGLTYTQVAQTDVVAWDGSASFRMRGAVHSAPIGGSPSAHTITIDHYIEGAGGDEGFYCAAAVDITGHDATTPIREVTGTPNVGVAGSSLGSGDSEQGTVEVPNTPIVGNKVVAWFFAGADGGGGFAAPTIGGQSMTQVFNQSNSWTQAGCWERTIDGTESTNIVTCTDLGQSVGQYTAVAVEVAADAGGATDVTANDSAHAHAADQPALTQTHVLASADASHGHAADQPGLTQVHAISVDSASHGHTADAAEITQIHQLTADDASHAHATGEPALTQAHSLAPDAATHAHSADQPTITSTGDLAVDSALHSHTADELALTQIHELVPDDAAHAHTADQPVLTSGVVITPNDALHSHAAEQSSLTQVHVLVPADTTHGHAAEQVALTQLHVLAAADALHTHAADAPAVTIGALPESIVTAQGAHSLIATATGAYALTVAANGTHDLIVEAEGAL